VEFYLPSASSEKIFRLQLVAAAETVPFNASITFCLPGSVTVAAARCRIAAATVTDCFLAHSSAAARCAVVINRRSCLSLVKGKCLLVMWK